MGDGSGDGAAQRSTPPPSPRRRLFRQPAELSKIERLIDDCISSP
ncbi:hypothetical protein MY11210_004290 [Beauveria gryllotalpidicola]